jgi:hypothetical protein
MGYAKYYEDIIEDREINREKLKEKRRVPPPKYKPFKCVYCDEKYETNTSLYEHMRLRHNTRASVLLLNGKIIEPGEYIEAMVETLVLVPNEAADSYFFNEKHKSIIHNIAQIDILSLQANDYESLIIEATNQKWTIYRSKLGPVNPIVNEYVKEINSALLHRIRPDLDYTDQFIKRYDLGLRDNQFINGFYEYCLACMAQGEEKNRLLYVAYSKLLPYIDDNPIARLVEKIICLQFLWLDRLEELCRISKVNEFTLVCDFFSGKLSSYSITSDVSSDMIFQVFVDDDEYRNTQEIVNFTKKEYNAVKRYLGEMMPRAENGEIASNLIDKIYLLQARVSDVDGDPEKAQHYRGRINSPAITKRMEIHHNGNTR